MKFYRVLSSDHEQEINKYFQEIIEKWNQEYARFELKFVLRKLCNGLCIQDNLDLEGLAMLDKKYLSIFNYALFGINHIDFDAASLEMSKLLWQQLFGKERIIIHSKCSPDSWYYPGSSSRVLDLICGTHTTSIYLNPDWVYSLLSKPKLEKKPLDNFEEAIHAPNLSCDLTLPYFKLPLSTLLNIQSGDLIKTDHPIDQTFLLHHKKQPLLNANLGISEGYKSIQIRGHYE